MPDQQPIELHSDPLANISTQDLNDLLDEPTLTQAVPGSNPTKVLDRLSQELDFPDDLIQDHLELPQPSQSSSHEFDLADQIDDADLQELAQSFETGQMVHSQEIAQQAAPSQAPPVTLDVPDDFGELIAEFIAENREAVYVSPSTHDNHYEGNLEESNPSFLEDYDFSNVALATDDDSPWDECSVYDGYDDHDDYGDFDE